MTSLTRSQMQEDLMYLSKLLVKSHPDPFWGAGGAVNFYRRVDDIYRALPDRLSVQQYLDRIRPLVASLRDGHTKIGMARTDNMDASHLPVDFGILADGLYVDRVAAPEFLGLLGSHLRAVNGVPIDEIADRIMEYQGCDNRMQVLCRVVDAFYEPEVWAKLLRIDACDHLDLGLNTVRGEDLSMRCEWATNPPTLKPPSIFTLPRLEANQLGWGFLDPNQKVAILRVGSLMRYREAGEVWLQSGFRRPLEEWYGEITHSVTSPTDSELEKFVAGVPSATEVLQDCLFAMAQAKTSWLIVDVRESLGGNSALADILGLSLFGSEPLGSLNPGYQVRRYSELYRENYGQLPDDDFFPGGYDFREARQWEERIRQEPQEEADALSWLASVPTFQKAWQDLPQYRPHVVVVTSARTYSAGFDVVLTLRGLGAQHVGVSSSQAPNCFIDVLRFTLPHSEVSGIVSFKQSLALPQLGAEVRTLVPHHELTYDKLRGFDFDPEASIRLALNVISDLGQV